jgi:hypothetical protein
MPNSLTRLMRNLDELSGDERGHLVAASLGGTNDAFNIVPQHNSVNRRANSGSHWFTTENNIREFVSRDVRRVVDLHIVILYGDLSVSRRPTAFVVQAIFYNSDSSINRSTGSCYFTNNPNGPNVDEPDLGFSRRRRFIKPPKTTKRPPGDNSSPEDASSEDASSEDVDASPEDASSEDVDASPEDASSEDVDASPEDVDASPEDVDASPEDVDASPEDVDASPEDVDASPEDVDTSPEDVDASPEDASPEEY